MGDFVGEKNIVNVQLNQRVDIVESTFNKRMDEFQSEIAQKIDNLQYSISRLTNQHKVQEKDKFPSQTQKNPKGVHEIGDSSKTAPKMDEVKAIITLRSGKKIEQSVLEPLDDAKEKQDEEPERIVIKEDTMKKSVTLQNIP